MVYNKSIRVFYILKRFITFFLIFNIVLDPTNTFLRMKDISFLLFVILNFGNISFKNIKIFLIFICAYFCSFTVALLTEQQLNITLSFGILKSFVFLLFILWTHNDKLEIFKCFYYAVLIMCILEILIYLKVITAADGGKSVYYFMASRGSPIMISLNREMYGHKVIGVYYRTSAMSAITLSVSLFFLNQKKKFIYLIHTFIFIAGLFCSGTRANMLAGLMIIFFHFVYFIFYQKKLKILTITILSVGIISFSWVVFFLLTTHEFSTDVKSGHLQSFINLFAQYPFRILFFGLGPGAYMYSSGTGYVQGLTELSYLELIKNYGFLWTILILGCFIYPIFKKCTCNYVSRLEKFSITIGYLAYLFIAGTNPLLIGSTGFTVFAVILYISDKSLFQEIYCTKKERVRKTILTYGV